MKQNKIMGARATRWGYILLMLVIISGCGFHLREDIVLPALYERVHVIDKGYSDVGKSLSNALRNAGSKIVSSPESATAVVTLLSPGVQRRTLNVGGSQILEYELQLDILFVVQDHEGTQLSAPQKVSVVRNFRNDPDDVLGKNNEENIIRQEMMQPAVMRVLRRLKSLAK